MLQLSILHEGTSLKIHTIQDNETSTTLTTFDNNKGLIDLGVIKDRVGEQVVIAHYNKNGDEIIFDYEQRKTISKVDKDSDGVWFIEYV